MLIVIDSKKLDKLITDLKGLFEFSEAAGDYTRGYRDGRNDAATEAIETVQSFQKDVLT